MQNQSVGGAVPPRKALRENLRLLLAALAALPLCLGGGRIAPLSASEVTGPPPLLSIFSLGLRLISLGLSIVRILMMTLRAHLDGPG